MQQAARRLVQVAVSLATGITVGLSPSGTAGGSQPATAAGTQLAATAATQPAAAGGVRPATGRTVTAGQSSTAAAVYSPRTAITFNNPQGTRPQQLAIITQIDRAVDAAPRGSTVTAAQYHFDISSTAFKLVAAHRRGVNVKLLIDDGFRTKQVTSLRKALGANEKKRSFVTSCRRSCMTNVPSVMHAKFFLFSTSGRAKQVTMVSSANVYTDNTFTSWNNLHTIVGNAVLHRSLSRYFADMITDRNNPNYYRTALSGPYKLYMYPRAARTGTNTVLLLDVLNNVTCTGVARGYGRGGRTVIRVAVWGWSAARTDLARKLWQLHDRGCRVEVLLNKATSSPNVRAALLKRSTRSGLMPVHDGWYDRNRNGKAELYVHHKVMTINGRWFGRSTKVAYTGSQNYTGPGTRANNEVVLRVKNNATVDAYGANLDQIRNRHTKKMNRVG